MSATVTYACGGCDAKAEGYQPLRKRFLSVSGRDYGIGSVVWDIGPDEAKQPK